MTLWYWIISSEYRIYALVNWASIGLGNGLLPVRRQAITWTNADLVLKGTLRTNLSEIRIKIQNFSFMEMHLEMLSAKWQPFCPGEMTSHTRWLDFSIISDI